MKKDNEQNEQEKQNQESETPARQVSRASAAIAAVAVAGLAMPAAASELPQTEPAPVEQSQPAELSGDALDNLLKSADLKAGKSVRVIKTLEIRPGAVLARQYDR